MVGSGTGALVWIILRSTVSSSRHITRSVRISRTTRSCTLHDKGYGTYRVGACSPGWRLISCPEPGLGSALMCRGDAFGLVERPADWAHPPNPMPK